MVYRRTKARRFVVRSVRAVTMWRFLCALIFLCMLILLFTISMEAGLRSGAEVAGNGLLPVGLTLMV